VARGKRVFETFIRCCGRTRRRGVERQCGQRACRMHQGRYFCWYHFPPSPKKFGQGYLSMDKNESSPEPAAAERVVLPGSLTDDPGKRLTLLQWDEAKARHPGMLLLFKVGDFYEAFKDDAASAAAVLGLPMASRGGVRAVRFAESDLEANLRKLLRAGRRVALCEQVPG
jgi:hypothetical protein